MALGSNRRHGRLGSPRCVIEAALSALDGEGVALVARSAVIETAPIGPSLRRFANAAALVQTGLLPDAMLARLKVMERQFGRRPGGARWQPRVLDLDIVLWDGGAFSSRDLTIPHRAFRHRRFVLDPACAIAADWRDPATGLTLRHLRARLTRPRPAPR